jgi:hypothetical protein
MMGKSSPRFNDCAPESMISKGQPTDPTPMPARAHAPAAQRALAEAAARRRAELAGAAERPKEIGGRGGKEPVRYGDWEVRGLASDF